MRLSPFPYCALDPNHRVSNSPSSLPAVVPLKHGLNYEILEKGHVRFWLQAIKLSPSVSYRFIVNDKEVTSGEVMSYVLQKVFNT